MKLRRFLRVGVPLIAVMAMAACGTAPVDRSERPDSSSSLRAIASIPGDAYELVPGLAKDVLWTAAFSGIDVSLVRVDTATGKSTVISLGGSTSSGINSHLRVAPDGAIWLSDDYTMYRFDQVSETTTKLLFEPNDANAKADAMSTSAPLPGTWITGFSFNGDGELIIARNNVPVLEISSPKGEIRRTEQLPANLTTISDLYLRDGVLHAIPGRPTELDAAPSVRMANVKESASSGQLIPPLRSTLMGRTELFFADGSTLQAESQEGILMTSATGESVSIPLGHTLTERANPLGQLRTVEVSDELRGGGVDPAGKVWVLVSPVGGAGTELASLN